MSSRYVCVHCGSRFALATDEEPRCPSCLRKGGLEPVADAAVSGRRKGPILAAVLLGAALLAGAGYAYYVSVAPAKVEGEPPLEPLSKRDLRAYMEQAGVKSAREAGLLEPGEAAESLAEHASGGDDVAKARALAAYIGGRREAGAYQPFSLDVPRGIGPRTQAETLEALEGDDGAQLYPLEVAVLATAALREAGTPAMVAEVFAFPEERAPVDPSGQLGYYAVAVPAGGEGYAVVDVYGGHEQAPAEDAYRVLADTQAVAAQLTSRAYHLVHGDAEAGMALGLVEDALALDPRSPSARLLRAALLVGLASFEEALAEADAAFGVRGDAARRVGRSALLMLSGQMSRARTDLQAALEERPDYGLARVRLASFDLNAGDPAAALESIEMAERLDYASPELLLLRAQYDLVVGDTERAAKRAREVVTRFGHSFEAQLMAAQVFRATGHDDDMRRAVAAAIELVPEGRRADMRAQVESSMGAAAFEAPAPEPDDLALELELGAPEAADELELGLEAPSAPAEGPALMMGAPSDYQLFGAGDKLELRLGQ